MNLKKLVLISSLVLLCGFAAAQDDVVSDGKVPAGASVGLVSKPFELCIAENGWFRSGGSQYTDQILKVMIAQMATDLKIAESFNVHEILQEAGLRDQAAASKWVDQSSPRLQPGTLTLAETRWDITTGGTSSAGGSGSSFHFNVRGINLGFNLEKGSSSAVIAITISNLVNGKRPITIIGHGDYSSTNVSTSASFRVWALQNSLGINWQQYDSDPSYRRGCVSTKRAFDDLRKQLTALVSTKPE